LPQKISFFNLLDNKSSFKNYMVYQIFSQLLKFYCGKVKFQAGKINRACWAFE